MKKLVRPELFQNVSNGTSFKLCDGQTVAIKKNDILYLGETVYWTKERVNNRYICYPLNWTPIMIKSFAKYSGRVKRIFWGNALITMRGY